MKFANLPKDTIVLILQYYGRIRYWNGIYSDMFSENDERYSILSKIKQPHPLKYREMYYCLVVFFVALQ